MNGKYLTLAGRIRQELDELTRVAERVQRIWRQAQRTSDDAYVDAAALNLHGFYAGLERIFQRIALDIDGSLPSGQRWHQELLAQMAASVPEVRPPVIPPKLKEDLDRYRGFRHVVRNVYTFNLDPNQVGRLVSDLPDLVDRVGRALHEFADFLEKTGRGHA